jgi:hypothetical protein
MRLRCGISMVMVALLGTIASGPTASAPPMSRRQRSRLLGLVSLAALLLIPVFVSAQQLTLTISKAGTGTGTVTGKGSGIKCGAVCSSNIDAGKVINLSAKPAKDSIFAGWSGHADCSDGTVTLDAAKTCTATFTTYSLSVSKPGDGSGTISSKPAGIKCGAACSKNFKPSTTVTLIAKAAKGSVFAGWTGACAGTGPCSLTMNSNSSVTAVFDNPSLAPPDIVESIQSNPSVISGGVSTQVTITATLSSNTPFIKSSVTLLRYDADGNRIANLGQMFDDGTQGDATSGDNIFTKQISLKEIGPQYVVFRVSANVASQETTLSSNFLIPVSGKQAPEEMRNTLAANIRSGNLTAAYDKLGIVFNQAQILDNVPGNTLTSLADALSTCKVLHQSDLVQICGGSIVINGQTHDLQFFLVRDVVGHWRIISW